jgi:hypothetical protein
MKALYFSEVVLALIMGVLIFLYADPLNFSMGSMTYASFVSLGICAYVATLLFFWKEYARDEREMSHKFLSSRGAFLAGSTVVVVGVIFQSMHHMLDPWLPATLIAMSVAKLSLSWYLNAYK